MRNNKCRAGGIMIAGPSKGPDRNRKTKAIVKFIVISVIPAVVLNGNIDSI